MKPEKSPLFTQNEQAPLLDGNIEVDGGAGPEYWRARYMEARRALEEAEAQVERLSSVLAGLGDGLVMLNSDLRYTYVNPFTLRLMGRTEEEVLGQSFYTLYPSLEGTPYDEGMHTALREQRQVEVDIFFPANGRHWRTLINPSGSGLTVYFRDVTDLKTTEVIQRRLAAIVESSVDAIIGKTLQGIITNWNPAAERIFGYTAAEAIGKPKTILFPPDRLEEETLILERLRQGIPTEQFETLRVRKDGVTIHVSLTISPIRNSEGHIVGASTIARDITEHKKAELRQRFLAEAGGLLASSLDYQTTLQSVAQLMVPELANWCLIHLMDDAGALELASVGHQDKTKIEFVRQYSQRYPPNPNAPTGPYAVARSLKAEWSREITDAMLREAARDEEHYQLLRAGEIKSYICVPMAAHGAGLGAITLIAGPLGHLYDEEDVALAEEIARRAAIAIENARLYQAERERSEQLRAAIAEVHHRVKNSLQSVGALLEMQIPDERDSIPVEAVEDSLNQIKTIALVHDLLARDKPMGNVDAAQVLRNLAHLLSSSMSVGQKQVRIVVDAEPLETSTKIATALALTINELLTNAAKHYNSTQEGGLTSYHDTNNIAVTLQQRGDDIRVAVQDSGPGFPPDFTLALYANIGLQLAQTLVEHDLHGSLHFGNATGPKDPAAVLGGRVEIVFPASACNEE